MPFSVIDAYRLLSDAYPQATHPKTRLSMQQTHGQAKLRTLATVIQTDADLAAALALIPDDAVRAQIRAGLVPMLSFTPAS